MNQIKGTLYCIVSGMLYGFLGYFGVILVNMGLSVTNMLFWRFFIASIMMFCILKKPHFNYMVSRESFYTLLSGLCFYSSSTILFFFASTYIGTGLAMVIFFAYPAFVMLINRFILKKQDGSYYLALCILLIGIVLISDIQEVTFDLYGILIAIFSALFYALYVISSKNINIDPKLSSFMVCVGCSITCLICVILDKSFFIPLDLWSWMNICAISAICTAVPILLLLEGLKFVSPTKASILSVLEPIGVLICGIWLLDEVVSNMQIVGAILVLSGALVTLIPKNKR